MHQRNHNHCFGVHTDRWLLKTEVLMSSFVIVWNAYQICSICTQFSFSVHEKFSNRLGLNLMKFGSYIHNNFIKFLYQINKLKRKIHHSETLKSPLWNSGLSKDGHKPLEILQAILLVQLLVDIHKIHCPVKVTCRSLDWYYLALSGEFVATSLPLISQWPCTQHSLILYSLFKPLRLALYSLTSLSC